MYNYRTHVVLCVRIPLPRFDCCSCSVQLAPGIPANKRRPQSGTLPEWGFNWYRNLTYGQNTSINPFFYGTYLAPTKTAEPGTTVRVFLCFYVCVRALS